jgi:hypothetical protein
MRVTRWLTMAITPFEAFSNAVINIDEFYNNIAPHILLNGAGTITFQQ